MSTTANPKQRIYRTIEVAETTRNITLKGIETLQTQRFTTTYEVIRILQANPDHPLRIISKKRIDEKIEPLSFTLIEVSNEILANYRKREVPSFVLKVDGKLYYSAIPDNITFVFSNLLGAHKCAASGHECHRLSAASDEEGGCEKVRNFARHIERYPWITTGYETFNTRHDSFVVVKCLHYKKYPPRKTWIKSKEQN